MAYSDTYEVILISLKKYWVLILAALLQIYVIRLIWEHNLVIGSVDGNFFYPYISYQRRFDLAIALMVLCAFFFARKKIYKLLVNLSIKNEGLVVLFTYASGIALECWIRSRYQFSMAAVIQDLNANGFYSAAIQSPASQILQKFTEFAPQFPSVHVQANMPGKTLLYKIFQAFVSNPSTMGLIIIAISNLTGIIIFYLCKALFQDKLIAWTALLLCIFTPAKIQFQPILNTISPVLIYLSLLLIIYSTNKRMVVFALLAGVTLFFQFLFDPVPFGLGLIFLALLILFCLGNSFRYKFSSIVMYVSIGFAGTGIVFYLLTGFNLIEGFIYCLKDATHFNLNNRPYSIWVIQNLKEYVIGAGLASSFIIFLSALKLGDLKWELSEFSVARVILISFIITILILNFSGANRGEVTRLWIFLTPIQALLTAFFCNRNFGKDGYLVPLSTSYIQASISINSVGFVLVS